MKSLLTLTLLTGALAFSQTLTISSASVAADGRSFTVTMSMGNLAPAGTGAITGCFNMAGGSSDAGISLAGTADGNTVTFLSKAPYTAEDQPLIGIVAAPGCNLVSGSTTPTATSGIAVTNNSTWHGCSDSPLSSYAQYQGGPHLGNEFYGSGYRHACQFRSADGGLIVNVSNATEIHAWTFEFGNALSLYQDGILLSRNKLSSATDWVDVAWTGLSGSGTHTYKFLFTSPANAANLFTIADLQFVGGTLTGSARASDPIVGWCGDSIANLTGSGSAPDDTSGYDQFLTANSLGLVAQGYSASGQDISPTLASSCPGSEVPLDGSKLPALVLEAGRNDAFNGIPVGNPTTPGTFEGDLYSMIVNSAPNMVRGTASNQPPNPSAGGAILVRGFTDSNGVSSDTRTAYLNAEQAAVSAAQSTLESTYPHLNLCYYAPPSGFLSISPAGPYPLDTVDGNHYNDSPVYPDTHAAGKLANWEAPVLYGSIPGNSSYSIAGPSNGITGAAMTFTVTLANGAGTAFIASPAETITVTDGGAGGAFASSIGGGTGSATFTPSSGTSFTFTYTPAMPGTVTLTSSNGQACWTNPAPVTLAIVGAGSISQSILLNGTYAYNAVAIPVAPANRVEFYLHDWPRFPASNPHLIQNGATGWNVYIYNNGANGLTIGCYNLWDNGPGMQIGLVGLPTQGAYLRVQHDPTKKIDYMEMWDTDGNRISFAELPYTSENDNGNDLLVSGASVPMAFGWYRIHTSLLPLNSYPPRTVDDANRLLEWKFDGSLDDSSGNGYHAAMLPGGSWSYVATPYTGVHSLIKANGNTMINVQSVRAGSTATLDGTASNSQAPSSSSAVSCFWQELSGPSFLFWTGQSTCTPTISGTVFGDYLIQLTVTDVAGNSDTSSVDVGAVATDNNGVVVNANPLVDALFGPQIAFGASGWPFMDYWHKHALDMRAATYDAWGWTSLQWEQLGSGTVNYTWGGTGLYPGNNHQSTWTASPITATSMTIPVVDASQLDLSELPTRILLLNSIAYPGVTSEEVRICGASSTTGPANLTVCYDGRASGGTTASAFPVDTPIGQYRIAGTGTHFLTDTAAPVCPLGPGPPGPALNATGTVTLTTGSTTVTNTGGHWPSVIESGFVSLAGSMLRVQATHGGVPFNFIAPVVTGGAKIDPVPGSYTFNPSTGGITGVQVYYTGQGYTPGQVNVAISDPTGSGAVITANVSGGAVTSYTVVSEGSGYTAPVFSVEPTQVILGRAFPSDADSGTYSNYALMSGNRTLVLRAPHLFDLTGPKTTESLWNTSGCETETSVYSNPSGYYQSFGYTHDVPQLDGLYITGTNYSVTDSTSFVNQGVAGGIDFYCEGCASRSMYYRSGLNSALSAAQVIDSWMAKSPWGNRETNGFATLFVGGVGIGAWMSYVLDPQTHLSIQDVRAYTIAGEGALTGIYNHGSPLCDTDDSRDTGYNLTWLALGAIYDPDTTSPASCPVGCRARWQSDLAMMQAVDNVCKRSDNSWANAFYSQGTTGNFNVPVTLTRGSNVASGTYIAPTSQGVNICSGVPGATGTATIEAGSGTLTITSGTLVTSPQGGTTFGIVLNGQGDNLTQQYAYTANSGDSTATLSALWPGLSENVTWMVVNNGSQDALTQSMTSFVSNADDIPDASLNFACIYNNSSSLTLDRPWPGATGTYYGKTYLITGYGQQPFMLGIRSYGQSLLAKSGIPTYAAAYQSLLSDSTNWIRDNAIDPVNLTVNYGRVFQFCEPYVTPNGSFFSKQPGCSYGLSTGGYAEGRAQNQELGNAIAEWFLNNPTSDNKTYGDRSYGAVWGSDVLGSSPYQDPFSLAQNPQGSNLSDASIGEGKWYGFFCGIGNCASWPATRFGGVAAPDNRSIYVPFTLSGISSASKAQVTITQPNGLATTTVCPASPCKVQVDARTGSVLIKTDYLNASGAIVAPGETIPLYIAK